MRMRASHTSKEQKRKRHERNREYKAAVRRENGIPVRRLKNPKGNYGEGRALKKTGLFLDRVKLLKYLDKYITVEEVGRNATQGGRLILNGYRFDETDQKYIRKVRAGGIEMVRYDRIDELAAKYKLPMWEIERKCLLKEADPQESSAHNS